MTDVSTCPDWCTVEDCRGREHTRYQLPNIIASRSHPRTLDERGAILPAVGVGIFGGEDSSYGTSISLTVGGVNEHLEDLEFTPADAFELAIALLDTYRMVIQEVDKPAAPCPGINSLRPIIETIEHNLKRHRRETDETRRQVQFDGQFDATESEYDAVMTKIADIVMEQENGGLAASRNSLDGDVPDSTTDSSDIAELKAGARATTSTDNQKDFK